MLNIKYQYLVFILFIQYGLVACGSVDTKKETNKASISDSYSGYFFDASISGLDVVPIKNKLSNTKIEKYIRSSNVRWQLTGQVDKGIVVRVKEIVDQQTL
jgi:hypothetical protein